MANITKISGVLYSAITRIGPKLKADVQRVAGRDRPPTTPTCTEYTFGYSSNSSSEACSNFAAGSTGTYYHDESTGTLYSDSCGGTQAGDGYYADRSGYRSYFSGTLSEILGRCRR